MPDIKCEFPGCKATISDPCIQVNALFLKKNELVTQLDESIDPSQVKKKIALVDTMLQDVIGLDEHQSHFTEFTKKKRRLSDISHAHVFTLECINGHRLQYNVTCKE